MEDDQFTGANDRHAAISTSRKFLYTASTLIIGFAIGFMLLVLWWLVYPYKTADLEVPVQVMNEGHEIAVGEPIILKVKATKYSDVTPVRSEFITCNDGSLTFIAPGESRNLPPGTYTIINEDNVLPPKLLPGAVCRFHFRYNYKVNPLRIVVKTWVSDNFTVVERGKNELSDS